MSNEVIKYSEKAIQGISSLASANDNMQYALDEINKAIEILNGDNWSGECKNVTEDLLKLSVQLHENILNRIKDIPTAFAKIEQDVNIYEGMSDTLYKWRNYE